MKRYGLIIIGVIVPAFLWMNCNHLSAMETDSIISDTIYSEDSSKVTITNTITKIDTVKECSADLHAEESALSVSDVVLTIVNVLAYLCSLLVVAYIGYRFILKKGVIKQSDKEDIKTPEVAPLSENFRNQVLPLIEKFMEGVNKAKEEVLDKKETEKEADSNTENTEDEGAEDNAVNKEEEGAGSEMGEQVEEDDEKAGTAASMDDVPKTSETETEDENNKEGLLVNLLSGIVEIHEEYIKAKNEEIAEKSAQFAEEKKEWDKEKEENRKEHEAALEAMKESHIKEIKEKEKEWKTKLEEQKNTAEMKAKEQKAAFESEKKELKGRLASVEGEWKSKLEEQKRTFTQREEILKTSHAEQIKQLNGKHQQELLQLQETHQVQLKEEIKKTEEYRQYAEFVAMPRQQILDYSKKAVELIQLVQDVRLKALDFEHKNLFADENVAYFYQKSMNKFVKTTSSKTIDGWISELPHFARTGMYSTDTFSLLHSVFSDKKNAADQLKSLKLRLHHDLMAEYGSAALILLQELSSLEQLSGTRIDSSVINFFGETLKTVLKKLVELEYQIVYVELFTKFRGSDDFKSVGSVEVDAFEHNVVLEVQKMAIRYGGTKDKTEVIINR